MNLPIEVCGVEPPYWEVSPMTGNKLETVNHMSWTHCMLQTSVEAPIKIGGKGAGIVPASIDPGPDWWDAFLSDTNNVLIIILALAGIVSGLIHYWLNVRQKGQSNGNVL